MKLSDAFMMALGSIQAHKLRSFLTLVGIVAGVSSIIGVMTGISVVQNTMEMEMSVLGTTTFQVQKWPPRGFNNDVDWREIQRREPVSMSDVLAVRESVATADRVGAEYWGYGTTVKYKGESTNPNMMVCGGTPEYPANNTHWVDLGRNLTRDDVRLQRRSVVLGHAIAERLFPFTDPLGKIVKVDGHKVTVVGVFGEKSSAMGGNFDNYVLMPITLFTRLYGTMRDDFPRSINMTVNARSPEVLAEAIEETRAVLRANRGVKPGAPDDFYVFTNDSQIKQFNEATSGVKLGAFVIGIIALIVAGIGIMNIMLVSVTERTREIGVRKALGAGRRDIMIQFLFEAVVLCNLGGIMGVAVGFGLGNLVSVFAGFPASVPLDWAVNGLLFCSAVGLTFGLWPALRAARLQPVIALSHD